uniref:MSP domain-containing protein n=1 Tax=Parascaris univalens TaxID=6257 RepID=A0A915BR44_PARUN
CAFFKALVISSSTNFLSAKRLAYRDIISGMAHPTEIFFPKTSQPNTRRLVLRNKTNCDYAVKVRGNSPFIWIEPAQGFLRSGCAQAINVSFDATQPELLKNSPQLLQVFCRPVTRRTEAICRRWFRAPVENNAQTQQQLAQTLSVGCSDGFVALETLLDLPCNALAVQSEPFPTLCADDSDTTTARAIDCDTETACGISKDEIMALIPEEVQVATARCVGSDVQIAAARRPVGVQAATARGVMSEVATARAVNQTSGCYWMNRMIDRVFPAEEGRETVPPCGAGR